LPDYYKAPSLIDEFVPRLVAVTHDIVAGSEYTVGEPVVVHEPGDILDRVEFWTFGWERNDTDIAENIQLISHMSTGLTHQ
jgi:hypothetical protein